MKKTFIQDERVVLQRRKINSEAFGLLMIVLYCSIMIQQFFLDAPVEQYAVETICAIGGSFYLIARYYFLGLDLYGEGSTKRKYRVILIGSFTSGIVVTVINGIANYSKYAASYQNDDFVYYIGGLVFTFIGATLFAFIVLLGVHYFNAKKQSKILEHLDNDNDGNV